MPEYAELKTEPLFSTGMKGDESVKLSGLKALF